MDDDDWRKGRRIPTWQELLWRHGYWGLRTWANIVAWLLLLALVAASIPVCITGGQKVANCKHERNVCRDKYTGVVYDGQGHAWDKEGNFLNIKYSKYGKIIPFLEICADEYNHCVKQPYKQIVAGGIVFLCGIIPLLFFKFVSTPPGETPFLFKYQEGAADSHEKGHQYSGKIKYIIIQSGDTRFKVPANTSRGKMLLKYIVYQQCQKDMRKKTSSMDSILSADGAIRIDMLPNGTKRLDRVGEHEEFDMSTQSSTLSATSNEIEEATIIGIEEEGQKEDPAKEGVELTRQSK